MLEDLTKNISQFAGQNAAPVEKWNPPFCGNIDMRIGRDGLWYYLGTPIGRKPLVKLFASVLRKDIDDKTYLVTPVEKIGIIVEDGHFLGIEMKVEGLGKKQIIHIKTQTDEWVTINQNHPVRFGQDILHPEEVGNLVPYIHMRGRLECRINRAIFYDLFELCTQKEIQGQLWLGLWSSGEFYPMIEIDKIS